MLRSIVLIAIALLVPLVVGCDTAEKTYDSTVSIAQDGIKKISPAAKDAQDLATGEVEKMFKQEYLVREFGAEMPPLEIERKLNGLGAERWQCFSVQQLADGTTRVFCNRAPISYLRYALQYMPGF